MEYWRGKEEKRWRIGSVVAHIQPRYADGYVDWYMAAIICEIDNGYLRAPPEGKRGHQMHICPLDSRLPSRMRSSILSFCFCLFSLVCSSCFLFFLPFCVCLCVFVLEKWFYGWMSVQLYVYVHKACIIHI